MPISVLSPEFPDSCIQTTSSIPPFGCQFYVLAKVELLIFLSSPQSSSTDSPQILIPSSPSQLMASSSFQLLRPGTLASSAILIPTSIFSICQELLRLFLHNSIRDPTTFHHLHCCSFDPSTDISNLNHSNRFVIGLSASLSLPRGLSQQGGQRDHYKMLS